MAKAGALSLPLQPRTLFLLGSVVNPGIMSGVALGFLVMLFWVAAITKFELSYAYASMSLAFVLVLILSTLLLH
jgi:hypothetical protein